MSLTIEQLEEKITRAKKDAEALRATGDSSRRSEVLAEYIEMLEEDLYRAKNFSENLQKPK